MTLPSADELARLLTEAGLPPLGEAARSSLLLHAAEMLRWNRAIRLTAVTDPLEVAVKHVVDSLSLLRFAPFEGTILDFGSGAGYPGIPLAVCFPACRVTLLDASGKKCSFLSHVRSRLALENVSVVHGHLEKRLSPLPAGSFDHVVTRATLAPAEAVALLAPLLSPGGRLLLMEGPGGAARGEVPPGPLHPGRVESFSLPGRMGERTVREFVSPPSA